MPGRGYFPVLNGNANYYYSGSDFPLKDDWSYGLNLSVPIFNGFLTRHQVAEAQANYGTVSANEESLRLDIYSQVNQGYLSLRAAEERISAAELGVRQAKENVDLATGRYEAGVGGPLEVTDAIVAQGNCGGRLYGSPYGLQERSGRHRKGHRGKTMKKIIAAVIALAARRRWYHLLYEEPGRKSRNTRPSDFARAHQIEHYRDRHRERRDHRSRGHAGFGYAQQAECRLQFPCEERDRS